MDIHECPDGCGAEHLVGARNPEPCRSTVRDALQKAFPYDWAQLLREMRWSSLDRCWLAPFAGMTVGIETDGYVHS